MQEMPLNLCGMPGLGKSPFKQMYILVGSDKQSPENLAKYLATMDTSDITDEDKSPLC